MPNFEAYFKSPKVLKSRPISNYLKRQPNLFGQLKDQYNDKQPQQKFNPSTLQAIIIDNHISFDLTDF